MTIPSTVEVFGHSYRVERHKGKKSPEGTCDLWGQVISIHEKLCGDEETETLLHEIVEAANHILCLDMDHHAISAMGNLLFQQAKGAPWVNSAGRCAASVEQR